MQVKHEHIHRYQALTATVASEIDAHNDAVRRFNDRAFELHQEVERLLDSANDVINRLNDLGADVCTSLRLQAEAEGINPDEGQASEMLDSWAELASLPELETPDCPELDEVVLGSKQHPMPEPLTGPVSEAEALIQQRIDALQAELTELRKRRQVQNRREST